MKKLIRIIFVMMLVLSTQPLTTYADRGGHGGGGGHGGHGGQTWHGGTSVVISPGWWPGWWGGYYPYYPYYPYPYYPQSPVIIRESSDLYVQPAPQTDEGRYWYYCPDAKGYYPDVKKCPQGWLKVVPPSEPPAGRD